MSPSNIGARKDRNILDHLFVINGIINDITHSKESKNIDLQIYDVAKCFDKLEHVNFYSAGVNNDKFVTVNNSNKKCDVAVKTPCGLTPRISLHNIEIQSSQD